MSNTLEILNPDRQVRFSNGRVITVRELPWKKQKVALQRILATLGPLAGMLTEKEIQITLGALTERVTETRDLAEFIVAETTGLPAEQIDALTATEFFALLDVAIDLNVAAYRDGAKKTFGRITSFVGRNGAAQSIPSEASPQPSTS